MSPATINSAESENSWKTRVNKPDIRNLSYQELLHYLEKSGERSFRATQIFEWIYQKGVKSFAGMRNLPKGLTRKLSEDFTLASLVAAKRQISKDGTTKFLFELCDHEKIETVLIPTATRTTVCLSTQAGCKFGCGFCASGIGGWRRNLTCGEILGQILCVKDAVSDKPLSHVVFMGMGEPLDNYDNVLKSVRVINSPHGLNIAARRITLSTCGLIPKIRKLAQEGLQFELAVSLHGYDDASRDCLMPVNKKYPVKDLITACREYVQATKRQITFEYVLIKDVTCTKGAAKMLGKLLKGMICKMNLIPYNKVGEFDYCPPSRKEILSFKESLSRFSVHATIRSPRGQDIAAACGQLRHASQISSKMA